MKTLLEINDNYIKEIVEFFCYEYYKMYIKRTDNQSEIIYQAVNHQIKKLLSHLLTDWKLQIERQPYNISTKRDNLISHILGGEDLKYPPLKFNFLYQQSTGLEIKVLDIIVQL